MQEQIKIIDRRPSYSDIDMLTYCEALKMVLLKTTMKNKGSGKNLRIVEELKYTNVKDELIKVTKSCEYYRSLVSNPFSFREYQLELMDKGVEILSRHRFLYLAMEVRTGKTLTSLGIANMVGASNILFVTKKMAIPSIEKDYALLNGADHPRFVVINYESLHKVCDKYKWDLVILDEGHSMGAFPKPNDRARTVCDIIKKYNPLVIILSGTPTPESYSQMYHQVYGIKNNPFKEFNSFYRFCDKYVDVKEKIINGLRMRDYNNGKVDIIEAMKPFTLNYTQSQAGFKVEITETILKVKLKDSTMRLINRLKRDRVVEGETEVILGDTPVKLMSKVHQLCSGTVKFESGESMVVDTSKAEFIKAHFSGKKIGIFYKFTQELNAIKEVYGDSITTDISVFKDTDKSIALQIVSGREGISLSEADILVYYNIDFSATSYWQSRDRMTTKERTHNNIYWVFSQGGIEDDIYKAVVKKKDYTLKHFNNGLLKDTEED